MLIAMLLLAMGAALGLAGLSERRLTSASKELETLQYAASADEYAQIEESTRLAARLPWLGARVQDAARAGSAAARYWLADYSALAPRRNAAAAVLQTEADDPFLASNAMYRAIALDGDRPAALQGIDAVLRSYAELLKKNPGHVDAAYNFEYVARVRNTLARSRSPVGKSDGKSRRATSSSVRSAGDLPVGPTLHGHPGAVPRSVSMGEFKTVIPRQKEERTDEPDAAKGSRKVRKG
jgi:hypothetical protein